MDKSLKGTEENIKVIVRIKPNFDVQNTFIKHDSEAGSVILPDRPMHTFDKVAGGDILQDDIFASCKDLFQSFIDGYNATIFAYGQTGSGKTFTMTGDCDSNGITRNPGLIPRGLSFIFNKVKERAINNNVEFLIKCSFVEIYNEQIYDLLDPQQQKLVLRFNISQEVFLEPCTEIILENPQMAEEILQRGLSNRHVASTEMNRESSRSHAVFSIVLESCESQGDISNIKKSSLYLVDLAGSERQRDAKTVGMRMKEAGMINKSLFTLSRVISSLAEASRINKPKFIAYRDSKLTLLLKDAIGGNSKTLLVACVHNDIRFAAETSSTLQFASSVKMIKNVAKINIDTQGDNESLRREIKLLREQLEKPKSLQIIQENEFDADLTWKKRFITAMALRSCSSREVSCLTDQLTKSTDSTTRLEKTVSMLRDESEIKSQKLRYLEDKLSGKAEMDDDFKQTVDRILQKLSKESHTLSEQINNNQLDIQVQYLASELDKSRTLIMLEGSEHSLVHSMINDYNSIITTGNCQDKTNDNQEGDDEIGNLKQELAQSRYKCSRMKRKMNTMTDNHRDERRRLESQIASMKSNVKAADEQREAAVTDRRKTLLSINDIPARGMINCRRRTTKQAILPIFEDGDQDECNLPGDLFVKANDKKVLELDKITALEDEIRTNKSQIGTMEYNLNEFKNEIGELKLKLASKENIEACLKEIEQKCNVATMNLQQSNESVKRLQREIEVLETAKDNTIKALNDNMYILESEIRTSETEREIYREECERVSLSLSLACLTEQQNKLYESLEAMKNEIAIKDVIISTLNSNSVDSVSIAENVNAQEAQRKEMDAVMKTNERHEMDILSLKARLEEEKARNTKVLKEISSLREEAEILRQEKVRVGNEYDEMSVLIGEVRQAMDDMDGKHRCKVAKMDEDYRSNCKGLEARIRDLQGERETLMSQVQGYEADYNMLRQKFNCASPKAGVRQSPRVTGSPNGGSPLRSGPGQFTRDDNRCRGSLIEDLVACNARLEEQLRFECDSMASVEEIVKAVFNDLDLKTDDSIVTNMETIRARIVAYKHEVKDLVIQRIVADKEARDRLDGMAKALCDTKWQRDSFKTQLDEVNEQVPNAGHQNLKQKIQNFKRTKEENAKLRAENVNMMDERERFRQWLIRMQLLDEAIGAKVFSK